MTDNKNPFVGTSQEAKFCRLIYNHIKRHERYTLRDVMLEYLDMEQFPRNKSVSHYKEYSKLKAANKYMCDNLDVRNVGKSKTRGAIYEYKGEKDDPLRDFVNSYIKKDLEDYWEFCQDSSDFLPESWLQHFFSNTRDMLEIEKKHRQGRQFIFSSANRKLKNVNLIPNLYEHIKAKNVLSIKYKKFTGEDFEYTFHPHCLKQYNERWFLFGFSGDNTGFTNIPVDRITEIEIIKHIEYRSLPSKIYFGFFSHRVGVSNNKDAEEVDLHVRVYTLYKYGLIASKPIHHSQRSFGEYDEEKGYGDFKLTLVPNNELFAQLLLWGEDVEIISPIPLRNKMKEKVKKLFMRYDSK